MQNDQFSVIYTGILNDGVTMDDAVQSFARLFKLPETKARAILNAGREVVLKPRAEHAAAYRLKRAIEETGLQVRLQRVSHAPAAPSIAPDTESSQADAGTDPTQDPETSQAGWSLVPIKQEDSETASEVGLHESAAKPQVGAISGVSPSDNGARVDGAVQADSDHQSSARGFNWDRLKGAGGIIGGVVALVLFLIKKLGLFKLLKIGGVLAASSMISFGYDPVMMCLENEACQTLVEEKDEDCWEASGLDDVDWDALSDEDFSALLTRIDQDYFGCMRYDNGQRAFLSPFTLQFDLMDNCSYEEDTECLRLAGEQMNACYDQVNMSSYVGSQTTDLYSEMLSNERKFKQFYQCFQTQSGTPLFDVVLSEWDYLYDPENFE